MKNLCRLSKYFYKSYSKKGKISEERLNYCHKAFDLLDPQNNGVIDLEFLKTHYNPAGHPLVKLGIKANDEILFEFIESFDEFHHHIFDCAGKGKVSRDEFIEYFTYVSACIENDEDFINMIQNVWRMEAPKPKIAPQEEIKVLPRIGTSSGKKGISNASSIENPLSLTSKLYNQIKSVKKEPVQTSVSSIIPTLRKKLASRGIRGIIGLSKQFKVFLPFLIENSYLMII